MTIKGKLCVQCMNPHYDGLCECDNAQEIERLENNGNNKMELTPTQKEKWSELNDRYTEARQERDKLIDIVEILLNSHERGLRELELHKTNLDCDEEVEVSREKTALAKKEPNETDIFAQKRAWLKDGREEVKMDLNKSVFRLTIGDWSSDGHGKFNDVLIISNSDVESVQEAYKASCKLTEVSFNHNEDYTGVMNEWTYEKKKAHMVCVEYEQCVLSSEVIDIFKKHNCPHIDGLDWSGGRAHVMQEHFIKLLMWFIGLSLPELEWKEGRDNIPVFNGYWDDNLNVQLGYGLF